MREKIRSSMNLYNLDYKLKRKEMNREKGGAVCKCACYYADSGGSSIHANGFSNHDGGLVSPHPHQLTVVG